MNNKQNNEIQSFDYYGKSDIERMTFIASKLPEQVNTLLDIGSWDGKFGEIISMNRNIKVVSVDIDPKSEKVIRADITNLPFAEGSIDCVTALEIIEHLNNKDLKRALSEIRRVAKKMIIVSVPFEESPLSEASHHLQYFDSEKLRKMIENRKVEVLDFGHSERPMGIRKLLARLHPKIYKGFNKIFGKKVVKTPCWLIALYQL